MEPHNNLLCLLQHFSKALCQPGGLRRERTLRVPHIADLKKRLASVDGQRFDVILLIGAVHKIQAQTANIRMKHVIYSDSDHSIINAIKFCCETEIFFSFTR